MNNKPCFTCNATGIVTGKEVKKWFETYNISSHYRFSDISKINDEEEYKCPTCEGYKYLT
jgi:hypothetical protein